jgi:hypothetical protein
MPIQYLQNSPVQFYKLTGRSVNDASIFENSAYDQRRIYDCDFITPSFCQEADINDVFAFQFKASNIGSELITEFFTPVDSGTNTSVSAGKLVDSGANFSSAGVVASYLVLNTSDNFSSYAISPIGTTTLDLNDDIFSATPKNYVIYPIRITGAWKFTTLGGKFYIDSPSGVSAVTFRNTAYFDSNKWYKVSLTVSDYVGGTLNVFLGTNNIGTITANGNYTFYGTPTGINVDLSFEADADFEGAFSNFSAYQLNQNYLIEIRDLSDTLVASINHTETTDSLTIGNIIIVSNWAAQLPEDYCGCYRFWIYDNVGCQLTNVLPNGDFSGDGGWTLTSNVAITTGELVFTDATATTDSATNYLFCGNDAIVFDGTTSYTVTFTISNRTEGGVYFVLGTTSSATYSLDGTYSFTITPGIAFDSMFSIVAAVTETSLTIDNVSVVVADEDLVVDAKSECFHVCDQDNCTIKLSWTNNTNSFGYYYESGFTNYMRLNARIRNAKINDLEFDPFKNSIGIMSMPYYNGQKVEELAVSPIPEYMHNALAVGLSHRTVTIQDVSYIRTGSYTPDWTDDSELAKVVVEVAKVDQTNLENRY